MKQAVFLFMFLFWVGIPLLIAQRSTAKVQIEGLGFVSIPSNLVLENETSRNFDRNGVTFDGFSAVFIEAGNTSSGGQGREDVVSLQFTTSLGPENSFTLNENFVLGKKDLEQYFESHKKVVLTIVEAKKGSVLGWDEAANVKIKNANAVRLGHTRTYSGEAPVTVVRYIISRNDRIHEIVLKCPSSRFDKWDTMLNAILNSIDFQNN
jgi:hypothetical protein